MKATKLISASECYFDIEGRPEVKVLLAQDYLEALEEIEEKTTSLFSRRYPESKAKQRCTFKRLPWSIGVR